MTLLDAIIGAICRVAFDYGYKFGVMTDEIEACMSQAADAHRDS